MAEYVSGYPAGLLYGWRMCGSDRANRGHGLGY